MLIRKIKKGLYEVLLEDDTESQYRVEDMRVSGSLPTAYKASQPWGVWEHINPQQAGKDFWKMGNELDVKDYTLLIEEKSFKDCIFAISLWEEANEILN